MNVMVKPFPNLGTEAEVTWRTPEITSAFIKSGNFDILLPKSGNFYAVPFYSVALAPNEYIIKRENGGKTKQKSSLSYFARLYSG